MVSAVLIVMQDWGQVRLAESGWQRQTATTARRPTRHNSRRTWAGLAMKHRLVTAMTQSKVPLAKGSASAIPPTGTFGA